MKFSCGETPKSRRWRKEQWHKWFAWYPVTVGVKHDRYQCVWLQEVECKGTLHNSWDIDCYWTWEYREIAT